MVFARLSGAASSRGG
jgi:3'-phosphoadenosine 5'-phosphosulfate (PAPS) 3'-phosphatase